MIRFLKQNYYILFSIPTTKLLHSNS